MLPYSQLRDPKRASLADQIPLDHPWSIYLELTNRCNFRCKFCPESIDDYAERAGGISKMTFDQFKKTCTDIKELGRLKVLRFYMLGEPFLHNELPEYISYAKELDIADRLELTSNGTALTPAKCDRIVGTGLDYVRISVYAIDPDRHKSITQSAITPAQIRDNVRMLFETRNKLGATKPFIVAKMINPFDETEERLFRESYAGICDEVFLEQPENWNDTDGFDALDNVYKGEIDRDQLFLYQKKACPFPFYTLVIHSSGDVSVCCVDWEKKTSVGNIFEQSLRDIWHGDRLRDFQRMQIEGRRHENEACRNCTFLYTTPDNIDEITSVEILYSKQQPPSP
jgi:radical SAM protein with 4Fe4S-binding SPASM domain